MKPQTKKISTIIDDRKFKIAEKLKIDIYQRNTPKFKICNYQPQLLYKDIVSFLQNVQLDKISNYNTFLLKVERYIMEHLNANISKTINTQRNRNGNNQNISGSDLDLAKNNLMNSKKYNFSQPKFVTLNLTNDDSCKLTDKTPLIKELNQLKDELISDEERKRDIIDLNNKSNINISSNSNNSPLLYNPRSEKFEDMQCRQNDEWSKISRMNQQEYYDEINRNKQKKQINKQEIKKMLLQQIIFKKERLKHEKEEEENSILKMNRECGRKFDQQENNKKKELKLKIMEIDKFRINTIKGKLNLLL